MSTTAVEIQMLVGILWRYVLANNAEARIEFDSVMTQTMRVSSGGTEPSYRP